MFKYLFSKLISKIHFPAVRSTLIENPVKIFQGSTINNCKIGKYTYIGPGMQINFCKIGRYCSIAGNGAIGGGSHPLTNVSTSPIFLNGKNAFNINISNHMYDAYQRTIIENDVWIGEGVYIKGGVHISNGAVIGMGAVVTHDVGPYEIWAGNPAKLIRKRFKDETIDFLLKTEWWNWNEIILKKKSEFFNNIEEFERNVRF